MVLCDMMPNMIRIASRLLEEYIDLTIRVEHPNGVAIVLANTYYNSAVVNVLHSDQSIMFSFGLVGPNTR